MNFRKNSPLSPALQLKIRKQVHLPIPALILNLPNLFPFQSGELSFDKAFINGGGSQHLPIAGDEELGAFQDDVHLLEHLKGYAAVASGGEDLSDSGGTDAGDSQQDFGGGAVDLYGKLVQVMDGPVALRIQLGVEEGLVFGEEFFCHESVVAHEPVCLVESMLSEEGNGGAELREGSVFVEGDVAGVEDALQVEDLIETLGGADQLQIGFISGADDHLGALAGFRKGTAECQILLLCGEGEGAGVGVHTGNPLYGISPDAVDQVAVDAGPFHPGIFADGEAVDSDGLGDLTHGAKDGLHALVGSQTLQTVLSRELHVDADTVCQETCGVDELLGGTGDSFYVDVSVKVIFGSKEAQCLTYLLHGVVRCPEYTGAQKQAFYIIALVELYSEGADVLRGEDGAGDIVALAAPAVLAVVDAVIGHQDLQEGDAASVCGKGVADSGGAGIAKHPLSAAALCTAAGAGDIVFGCVCQYG